MKFKNHPLLLLFILLAGLFALQSCMPERKIANTFVKSAGTLNLLVIPPDNVFKYNHKGESVDGFDEMTKDQQDSALWVDSRFVQYLSDSLVLENYMNNFIGELRLLGFNVYLSSAIDSFMTGKPQSYVVDLAQVQLDEYFYPLEDQESYMDTVYYKKTNLNAVDFACWFDLSKANTENAKKTVLYSSSTSYDSFEGRFYSDPFTGRVRYKYSIDSLSLRDIYEMANYLGKKHADYLFDFFMNQYIAKHLPEGTTIQDYYHYNRTRQSFSPADDDRFDILKNK
ncbi:MAG: hypothetical protein WCK34_08975 [Bacteroidota bacterium]